MTTEEAATMAKDIAYIADDLTQQLNKYKIKPTYVEEFYLGILSRERRILRDISNILMTNNDQQITSSFILFRVLLDDFIRLISVYSSSDMEEEVTKILADAYNHRFKSIKESVELNDNLYNGQNPSLLTQIQYDTAKQSFIDNSEFDNLFENKQSFKFKRLTPISDVFERIKTDVKIKANAHSYIVYKFLTQYVHYSNLAFSLDHDKNARKEEINQFEETLLYCYKMLLILYEYLNRRYALVWNDIKITAYFRAHTILV